jgi:hypothetical protein
MSDPEWERWTSSFRKEARPLPPILKRARTDRRREILGFIGIYAIGLAECVAAVDGLLKARTMLDAAPCILILATVAAAVVGAHVAMRGTLGAHGQAPLELLDAMAARHEGRRRLARFLPWCTGFLLFGIVGLAVAALIEKGRIDWGFVAVTLAAGGLTAGFVWFVVRKTHRLVERELAEISEARRLLTSEDA